MFRSGERLVVGPVGLVILRPGTATMMEWSAVQEVATFKKDLLTTDLICLEFIAGDRRVLVHEEIDGWEGLVEALPRHLSGFPAFGEWFPLVAHPAFATCWLPLFPQFERGAV